MQAAGKRKQSGKDARSSARAGADAAAGPGLQNYPGEYNCFLNVIVQCLWHCTAFRDAFLSLPRKVVKVRHGLALLCWSMPTAEWRHCHWQFALQHSQPHCPADMWQVAWQERWSGSLSMAVDGRCLRSQSETSLVTQADGVLAELSTLFRGFSNLAPGNIGQRTLDPTALRLSLANLDPKRFAAGRASIWEASASPCHLPPGHVIVPHALSLDGHAGNPAAGVHQTDVHW